MEAYSGFAEVYDQFMDNVPYDEWCAYLISLLGEYGIADGLILELGCGTGNMTVRLSQAGYDLIGVDNSEEMLSIAMNKRQEQKILYLLQDMREFELYGTVRAVICVCDSLNYVMEEEDLLQVFALVNNYLDPGGIFLFDLNTIFKYQQMGDSVIAENREDASFIWENTYYPDEQVNEYELTIFVEEQPEIYRKYAETHYQRGYELENVIRLLKEAGMTFEAVYDAFTKEPPKPESERVIFVAREHGKIVKE